MSDTWRLWLHGVTRDRMPVTVAGVGDAPVRVVPAAGLCAYVSPAPDDVSGADALQARLEDPAWLAQTAFEHHRVVAELAAAGPVVPAGLATVYRDDTGLAVALDRYAAELVGTLDRVNGRTEWGVKGYVSDAPVTEPAAPEPAAGGPGAAYLQRRRAELSARERSHDDAVRDADAVHDALARLADAAHLHAPQDRRLTGEPEVMVLNGAYLVPDPAAEAFAAAVEALDARYPGITLRLTGPWPPYSFVPSIGARRPDHDPVPAGGPA
ncbi:GvpL/GvpF family gas vesicle protein [Dactylosporangium aurantiacum]|uniref:GvpL/GvpF family gas vesicle protein n=1 Tax=Dactylosporangium aurantiacum TaxID=35754 RepID=A0A9Q9IBM1_9ACTN|nr:GvpL/GvpF family gas vesicle protein [Dactylosporangium aurantiacum]MDG6107112.1 GvpL/GvpF family gas vesicle protein [Dactylosporangium aurantiacum]UWZ51410.1 GvpL/GvpF family gas vesicle protein [Dactylosporangium aurantiacum]